MTDSLNVLPFIVNESSLTSVVVTRTYLSFEYNMDTSVSCGERRHKRTRERCSIGPDRRLSKSVPNIYENMVKTWVNLNS